MLDDLAHYVQLPLQLRRVKGLPTPADEHLPDAGLHAAGLPAQLAGVDGHVPPAQQLQAFVGHSLLHQRLAARLGLGLGRQEHHANAVLARAGQVYPQPGALLLEELAGHLDQYSGAVAGLRVAAAASPVPQIDQHLEGLDDDLVGLLPFDVGNYPHAAASVFQLGGVESVLGQLT